MEKVLITGISGGLGRLLAKRLMDRYEVCGVDRVDWPGRPEGVKVHVVDLTRKKFEDVVRTELPTHVVHMGFIRHFRTEDPKLTGTFGQIMKLADKYRKMGVRTNADTPHDTAVAVKFGAEGIGLTRTEHMFFEGDRIISMRKMILAETLEDRKKALKELLPLQRKDFTGIFRALKGKPATIRFLDPPLHEFVPHDKAGQAAMAKAMGVKPKVIADKVESLHEFNPMNPLATGHFYLFSFFLFSFFFTQNNVVC